MRALPTCQPDDFSLHERGYSQRFTPDEGLRRRNGVLSFLAMRAHDTTPRAAAIQLQLYREAGPSRRAQIAAELSDAARATTLAGIRRRHPEYSERELALSFLSIVYGFGKKR